MLESQPSVFDKFIHVVSQCHRGSTEGEGPRRRHPPDPSLALANCPSTRVTDAPDGDGTQAKRPGDGKDRRHGVMLQPLHVGDVAS